MAGEGMGWPSGDGPAAKRKPAQKPGPPQGLDPLGPRPRPAPFCGKDGEAVRKGCGRRATIPMPGGGVAITAGNGVLTGTAFREAESDAFLGGPERPRGGSVAEGTMAPVPT